MGVVGVDDSVRPRDAPFLAGICGEFAIDSHKSNEFRQTEQSCYRKNTRTLSAAMQKPVRSAISAAGSA